MAGLRFWLLTVTTTCLIWIAADQRVTQSREVRLPLRLRSVSKDLMSLKVVNGDVDSVTITFRGPNRSINELELVRADLAVELVISKRESGTYELELTEELSRQAEQFPSGLSIVAVDPPTLSLAVSLYVKRQVRLQADPGDLEFGQVRFDGEPQLDPAQVLATVPELEFDRLPDEQKTISIPLAAVFKAAPEGQLIRRTVVVPRMVGGVEILSVEPAEVTLSATLKAHTRQIELRTVPVWIRTSGDVADQYDIVLDGGESAAVTRAVTVRGPMELIRTMEEDLSRFDVKAVIELSLEDALQEREPGELILKVPQLINLPEGIEVVGEVERVEIQLVPRGS